VRSIDDEYKHWFRAKFYQQYRLFFRYREDAKLIVFAWRLPYGSKTDAYKVFRKMLNDGRPPDDWDALFKEAQVISEQGHPDSL